MPRALVTGGGGFIGSHLVDRLIEQGHQVRVLDNFATGRRENLLHLEDAVEIIEGDIQSYERVSNAVRGCDLVFHQAALPSVPRSIQDPLTSNAVNVVGTLNVLLASRDAGVRRVVFASSSSVYGAERTLPKAETLPTLPISPYAVAKLAGESYCRTFTHVYDLETVALRYFNVFGPRQDPMSEYAAVIPRFVTALLSGQAPVIFGDGEQSRDFTYIANVVDANVLAAEVDATSVAGRAFNIACGERISLNAAFETARRIVGTDLEPQYAEVRRGDVKHSLADISLAREHLGFQPQIGFEGGLGVCVDYYREQGAADNRVRA